MTIKRRELMEKVRKKVNGLLSEWRPDFQYQILPFGSTAYGLDTDNSDLDLCIFDPKRPEGFRHAADLYDLDADEADGHGAELGLVLVVECVEKVGREGLHIFLESLVQGVGEGADGCEDGVWH